MTAAEKITPALLSSHSAGLLARVAKGLGALSLGSVITLLAQLTIVPVAMHGWGAKRYGEWATLAALVGTLNLMDLGLQNFVVNRLCASYARDDRAEFLRTLHSALVLLVPLVTGILGLILFCVSLVPLGSLLKLTTVSGKYLAAVVLMLSFEPLLGVSVGILGGIYRATGRLARGAMVANCRSLILLCITLALIAHHASFLSVALARACAAIAVTCFFLGDLGRLYSWIGLWPSQGDFAEGLRMIMPSMYFLLIPVANYLGNELIIFIIQRFLGGVEVSRYSTHRIAIGAARMASTLLAVAVWPELTMVHARGHYDRLERMHRLFSRCNFWLVAGCIALTCAGLPLVYGIWTARQLVLDPWTLGILALRTVLWGSWSTSMTLLLSINHQEPVAGSLLVSALVAGLLGYWLIPSWGISGAALGLLIGDLCGPVWILPTIACREVKSGFWNYLRYRLALPLTALLAPAALAVAAWSILDSALTRYFVVVPLAAAIGLWSVLRQLEPLERRLLKQWFEQITTGSVLD
jgi:O-antigen/teichoic acid export membrane protein